MTLRIAPVAVLVGLVVALAGCSQAEEPPATSGQPAETAPTPTPTPTGTPTPTPTPTGSPSPAVMQCDPGGGFPKAKAGCPDPDPETGWLSLTRDGERVLEPFRTLGSDAEGRAYAEDRGLEFPFPNDYFDAPDGPAQEITLEPDTVCTGIIRVGYREPLEDHVVPCAALDEVAGDRAVPVAVWSVRDRVVQVSELYRP